MDEERNDVADSRSPDGVVVVNKPAGPTSHDIVLIARRISGAKIGHAGTLDPLATGVLVLLVGKATRLAKYLQLSDKHYEAVIRLGIETDTYDSGGEQTRLRPVPLLDRKKLESVLAHFIGTIDQLPPMFSAVRVGGERLYKAARRKEVKPRPSRRVSIHNLQLTDWGPDYLAVSLDCSSGTYVRTLASDIGRQIGCGAFLESLCRTRSGGFTLGSAVPLHQLEEKWRESLIPLHQIDLGIPTMEIAMPVQAERFRHGNPVEIPLPLQEGRYRILYEGMLLGIGLCRKGRIKPEVVLR